MSISAGGAEEVATSWHGPPLGLEVRGGVRVQVRDQSWYIIIGVTRSTYRSGRFRAADHLLRNSRWRRENKECLYYRFFDSHLRKQAMFGTMCYWSYWSSKISDVLLEPQLEHNKLLVCAFDISLSCYHVPSLCSKASGHHPRENVQNDQIGVDLQGDMCMRSAYMTWRCLY
jgi:hypothetical protein